MQSAVHHLDIHNVCMYCSADQKESTDEGVQRGSAEKDNLSISKEN